MADDVVGIVLVFFKEIRHAREGDLVDVLVNLFLRHADTMVADGDGTLVGIKIDTHGQVAEFTLEVALFLQGL